MSNTLLTFYIITCFLLIVFIVTRSGKDIFSSQSGDSSLESDPLNILIRYLVFFFITILLITATSVSYNNYKSRNIIDNIINDIPESDISKNQDNIII